ncbi:MAG: response regulator [Deltaproteobacteria bacterium]|jgi:two-component system, sensor histidine kinase and response regulator
MSAQADAATKDIPIIFITAFIETADKVKAFSMGAVDYVTKPFQADEIVARVRAHMDIRSLQRRLVDHNANLEQLVAERTRDLAKANRLKNDFLTMISHEIRTPANGVLGMGDLILDLCPASEERTLYAHHFQTSCLRLRNLIEDATMIVGMENVALKDQTAVLFSAILDEVKVSNPDLRISTDRKGAPEPVYLHRSHFLLKRALETMILWQPLSPQTGTQFISQRLSMPETFECVSTWIPCPSQRRRSPTSSKWNPLQGSHPVPNHWDWPRLLLTASSRLLAAR